MFGIMRLQFLSTLCLFVLYFDKVLGKLHITEQQGPVIPIEAVEGRSVSLPCDVTAPNAVDKVYMVFWFRADTGIPLYSFDVRGMSLNNAHHNSAPEVFGSRAFFRTISEPASLIVSDIRRHDQGLYRCRVDFRNSATKSFRYNLTIIVPPEKPSLFDQWGRLVNGTIGPLEEGDDVSLTCRVIGGTPEPKVRWLINGMVIDEEYEHNAGDVIENRLSLISISRNNLKNTLTCQATNTMLVEPLETSTTLDLRLRPLTIEMVTVDLPLVADRRYEISCITSGSRPAAVISWIQAGKLLRRTKEEVRENITISVLTFIPISDDNDKTITCRAENPNVTGLFLETHWKMSVIFAPIVTLRLGSTLRGDDIKEGDDVYFECSVKANPPWKKLNWLYNGAIINHNSSARVIRSHHSLVLQKVTKHSAGKYACVASNAEGETYSNELTFRVKYAPVCGNEKIVVIGASRSESLDIVCAVDADPPAQSFRWKFNNSGETLEVGSERFFSNGTISILRYTPVADLDYGTLSCWAHNNIGSQTIPCIFQLVAAGKPQGAQNCTLSNQTNSSIDIKCSAGYDGGLPQVFLLQLSTPQSTYPLFNITNDVPHFRLSDLQADTTFQITIYAINSKGRSNPTTLEEFSFKDPEKRTAIDGIGIVSVSPILGIVAGTILAVSLILALLLLNMWKSRNAFINQSNNDTCSNSTHKHVVLSINSTANHYDEINPDVVPEKYGNSTHKKRNMVIRSTNNNITKRLLDDDCQLFVDNKHYSEISTDTRQKLENKGANSPSTGSTTSCKDVTSSKDLEINCKIIKETLMTSRLPESCV